MLSSSNSNSRSQRYFERRERHQRNLIEMHGNDDGGRDDEIYQQFQKSNRNHRKYVLIKVPSLFPFDSLITRALKKCETIILN